MKKSEPNVHSFFHKYTIYRLYNMNNIKNYQEYVTEAKSERKIVQDLARHLSFDKDIIKYLNTSRAKRTEGWREILTRKLHGSQLDYVNYITKNMVSDYNPQITGYIKLDGGDSYSDSTNDGNPSSNKMSLGEIINDLSDRVINIEDTLGINPEDATTLDKVTNKLKEIGYEPDWIDDEDEEKDNEEE